MLCGNRYAKINVKVLIILLLVIVSLGASLFAARQARRSILAKRDLAAGNAAFDKEDWPAAYKHFSEYLGRRPNDVEILKKYAKARLSIRPLDPATIPGAIAAYRRIMRLDPQDETTYDELARLYTYIGNFNELAYIAGKRLDEHDPNNPKATLWLADALIRMEKPKEAQPILLKLIKHLDTLPDKHTEYVRACGLMSRIAAAQSSPDPNSPLEWLNRAVGYDPESVEALANRGRFYRITPDIPGLTKEDRLALARGDLTAADDTGTEDPRIRTFLCAEWIAHYEVDRADANLDRAAAELQAAEGLPPEKIEEHFFDLNDWTVRKFLLASELAVRTKAAMDRASLADEVLKVLTERRHRVQVLPSAIGLYIAAGEVSDARKCLDEYLDTMYTQDSGFSTFRPWWRMQRENPMLSSMCSSPLFLPMHPVLSCGGSSRRPTAERIRPDEPSAP